MPEMSTATKKERYLVIDVQRAGVLRGRAPTLVVDVQTIANVPDFIDPAAETRLAAAVRACTRGFYPKQGADPWKSEDQRHETFWMKDTEGEAPPFPVMVVGPLADGATS